MLKLRRIIWDNGLPSIGRDDYEVIDERGEKIGRMYRMNAVAGGEAWNWTVYGIAVSNSPPAGREPTREQAMAAFKAAWVTCEPRERGGSPYSITSSARTSTKSGTCRPIALAVFMLSTVSYFTGACTGRSAGFSPRRMRSTYPAARRY
jgi:hypothetical protein